MIFLILAILCNCGYTAAVRYSEAGETNRGAVTMVNYLAAFLISLAMTGGAAIPAWDKLGFTIGLGAVNGVLFLAWLWLYQCSVAKNGAALSSATAKLGVLLPTVGSILLFGETPGMPRIVGMVLTLAAFYLLYEKEEGNAPGSLFLLVLLPLIGGVADFDSKIFEVWGNPYHTTLFLCCTFASALLFSVILWFRRERKLTRKDIAFGVLIGIPNQLATLCFLRAIMTLPAYFAYPVYSMGAVLAVCILGYFLFGERLSRRQCVGILVICGILVLFNM